MKPIVFISHSTAEADAAGRTWIETLCTRLEGAGYDPKVDFRDIDAGHDWNSDIDEWMDECHAAVLLLSERALRSEWVRKEVTILIWRLGREKEFSVLPFLAPDLGSNRDEKLAALRAAYPALFLDRIQMKEGLDHDAITQTVRDEVTQPYEDTPFEKLVEYLTVRIKECDATLLDRLVVDLGRTPPGWRAGKDSSERCADVIARCALHGEWGNLANGLADLDERLQQGRVDASGRSEILHALSPLWVPADASAGLSATDASADRWAVALNGEYVLLYTSLMYIERAYPLVQQKRCCVVEHLQQGGDQLVELRARIWEVLETEFPRRSRERIVDRLRRRSQPIFITIPSFEWGDKIDQTLSALESDFPNVTFVLDTGREQPGTPAPRGTQFLDPPVDLDREANNLDLYENVKDAIGL